MNLKKILFALLVFGVLHSASAQNCDTYNPFVQGRQFVFETYDSKDRLVYTRKSLTAGVTKGGDVWQASFKDEFTDKNGEKLFDQQYAMKCENGVFFAEMRSLIFPAVLKSFKPENLRYDTKFIETGLKLKVGERLKENNLNIAVLSGVEIESTIQLKVFNRMFESEEYLETSFGRVKCMKIIYDLVYIVTTQDIPKKTYHRINEWYAPTIGIVKVTSYDKDGDLKTYTLLKEVINAK